LCLSFALFSGSSFHSTLPILEASGSKEHEVTPQT
jgi:hypothetical protein